VLPRRLLARGRDHHGVIEDTRCRTDYPGTIGINDACRLLAPCETASMARHPTVSDSIAGRLAVRDG
jgi:hypothetical protein